MQKLRTSIYVMLSLFALLSVYEVIMIYSSSELPIGPLNTLAFSVFMTLQFLVLLFNINLKEKTSGLDLLSTGSTILATVIMYLNRDYISSLWTLVFIFFTFQIGRLLYRLVRNNTIFTIANRWLIVISIIMIEILLITHSSFSLLYTTCGISLVILSIGLVAGYLLPQRFS